MSGVLCGGCLVVPRYWTVTLGGLSNRNCSNCGPLNGTHLLVPVFEPCTPGTWGTSCTWVKYGGDGSASPSFPPCTGNTPLGCLTKTKDMRLQMLTSGGLRTIRLDFFGTTSTGFGDALFVLQGPTVDCLGTNVLPRTSMVADAVRDCDGWPTSVTVSPA